MAVKITQQQLKVDFLWMLQTHILANDQMMSGSLALDCSDLARKIDANALIYSRLGEQAKEFYEGFLDTAKRPEWLLLETVEE